MFPAHAPPKRSGAILTLLPVWVTTVVAAQEADSPNSGRVKVIVTIAAGPADEAGPGRMTHDYKRHGTTTLFAALNVLEGTVIGSCHGRRRRACHRR